MVRTLIRRRLRRTLLLCVATLAVQRPIAAAEWQVDFPALKDGRACHASAVPVEDGSMLVTVVLSGADASRPEAKRSGTSVQVEVIGHDPVSRLCFLKPKVSLPMAGNAWEARTVPAPGVELLVGSERAKTSGWVKQLGTKVLPLALLRVNFEGSVPPPGTALLNQRGKLAALVFQQAAGGNCAYALPVEAIHRVRKDIVKSGDLVRGWLGLSLRAEIPTPQVTRVVAGSPADKVGIRSNDVILQIGDRVVSDYADSANAFFYLAPGDPVRMRLLRGADAMEVTVTPVAAPARDGASR